MSKFEDFGIDYEGCIVKECYYDQNDKYWNNLVKIHDLNNEYIGWFYTFRLNEWESLINEEDVQAIVYTDIKNNKKWIFGNYHEANAFKLLHNYVKIETLKHYFETGFDLYELSVQLLNKDHTYFKMYGFTDNEIKNIKIHYKNVI